MSAVLICCFFPPICLFCLFPIHLALSHPSDLCLYQTTMTSSKSDLEAKEGQIPNESNFLEFVSLLGSLSTRAGGSSMQEDKASEHKDEVETAEEGES